MRGNFERHRSQRPRHAADSDRGQRRTEENLLGAADQEADVLRVRDYRAGRGLGRGCDEHDVPARGRRVHHQRHQAFYLERVACGLVRDVRDVGPAAQAQRHLVLRVSIERAGHHAQPDAWQARPARGRHRRDFLRGRTGSRQCAGRARGRGLQVRDGDVRSQPARDWRDRDWNRAAGARRMPQVLETAQRIRAADRKLPGDPVHDGRYGNRYRSDAFADVQGRVAG